MLFFYGIEFHSKLYKHDASLSASRLPLSLSLSQSFLVLPLLVYSVLQVDFILGREIEIGGIYKGRVSSIKEYGAFVEFNGGQQGLLHISELSHEPVRRTLHCFRILIPSHTLCV